MLIPSYLSVYACGVAGDPLRNYVTRNEQQGKAIGTLIANGPQR